MRYYFCVKNIIGQKQKKTYLKHTDIRYKSGEIKHITQKALQLRARVEGFVKNKVNYDEKQEDPDSQQHC